MSTIWTPSGERPVGPRPSEPAASPEPGVAGGPGEEEISEEELARQMAEVQERIRSTPASAIVVNHCVGLVQLAVIHLDPEAADPAEAKLAIDALAGVLDAVGDRLGPDAGGMADVLTQLRLSYVELRKSSGSG